MAAPTPEPRDDMLPESDQDATWTAFACSPWDHPLHRQALAALRAHARRQRAGNGMHRWQAITAALRSMRMGSPSPAESGLTLQIPQERQA